MTDIHVISWDKTEIPEDGEEMGWWGGFFSAGMRWTDYLEEIDADIHPYLEAARSAALAHEIKATGYQHQYDRITPVFSDGKYFALTFRAWGDFMAAVWSEAEDRNYSYMDFYM